MQASNFQLQTLKEELRREMQQGMELLIQQSRGGEERPNKASQQADAPRAPRISLPARMNERILALENEVKTLKNETRGLREETE